MPLLVKEKAFGKIVGAKEGKGVGVSGLAKVKNLSSVGRSTGKRRITTKFNKKNATQRRGFNRMGPVLIGGKPAPLRREEKT